jgi:hypothetical protein
MQRIPTKTHGVLDYATGALLLAAPRLLALRTARTSALLRAAGGGTLAASLLTDYELGVKRTLPMRTHLALDLATGALLAGGPWVLGSARRGAREWLPGLLMGATEIAIAARTEPRPADRAATPAPPPGGSASDPYAGGEPTPAGAAGAPEPGRALRSAGVVRAPSPVETPGPSVTPPVLPESDTEREEWADETRPDVELLEEREGGTIDELVAQEEAAAAAEAASIGGDVPEEDYLSPEMRPVYEAGQGEAEGFEMAEEDLIENATHAEGRGDPLRDAFFPEAESDESSVVYGEPDEEDVTEVVADPDSEAPGDEDPGAGPNIAPDR